MEEQPASTKNSPSRLAAITNKIVALVSSPLRHSISEIHHSMEVEVRRHDGDNRSNCHLLYSWMRRLQ